MIPDGTYTIYVIEQFYNNVGWKDPGNVFLIGRLSPNVIYKDNEMQEPYVQFSSHGECWKKTGIFGSFDKVKAQEFFEIIRKVDETIKYRLAEMQISKSTTIIEENEALPYVKTENGIEYVCFPFGNYDLKQIKSVLDALKNKSELEMFTFRKTIDLDGKLTDWLIKNKLICTVQHTIPVNAFTYISTPEGVLENLNRIFSF